MDIFLSTTHRQQEILRRFIFIEKPWIIFLRVGSILCLPGALSRLQAPDNRIPTHGTMGILSSLRDREQLYIREFQGESWFREDRSTCHPQITNSMGSYKTCRTVFKFQFILILSLHPPLSCSSHVAVVFVQSHIGTCCWWWSISASLLLCFCF